MILVTGAAGFLGTYVMLDLLANNLEVRAVKRSSTDLSSMKQVFTFFGKQDAFEKISWVDGNLTDIDFVCDVTSGVHHVYHCAARVSFSAKNSNELIANNVLAATNVVNACLINNVQKLCYVSSIAALGHEELITEKTAWDKKEVHSAYSLSKYLSELEAWRGNAEGLSTIIVSPSVIIGPWQIQQGLYPYLEKINKGMTFYTSGSSAFVDVRDVAAIMVRLMQSEQQGENYIVSAENITYQDLSKKIADIIHVKPPHKCASEFQIKIAQLVMYLKAALTGKPNHFTKDAARIAQKKIVVSAEKLNSLLNHAYIKSSDSLRLMFEFQKNNFKNE